MDNFKLAETFAPGEFIQDELNERGWTQEELAMILGRSRVVVNRIISGKTSITPETANELAAVFGSSVEFWMNLDMQYRLSNTETANPEISERAQLFEKYPVKDMQKRGWIKKSKSITELKSELKRFFNVDSLEESPKLKAAARSSIDASQKMSPEQLAWCFRAKQMASLQTVSKFTIKAAKTLAKTISKLATQPELVRHVPTALAEAGIRFVIVEHLPRTKIDAAALWLGKGWSSPVIAMSLRYDRIDYFWHTLCHELSHVIHKDNNATLDVDINNRNQHLDSSSSAIEKRADEEASAMLISRKIFADFVHRISPMYSRNRIVQFSNLHRIHPGIVAGQLQFLGEIKYSSHRDMLSKVRSIIIDAAITDGWGYFPSKED